MHDDSTQAIHSPRSSRLLQQCNDDTILDHPRTAKGLVTPCATDQSREEVSIINKKQRKKGGLQDLPPELLFKIKHHLVDLPDHASFWSLCHQTSALYQEDEIRNLCLRANIGRPNLFADKTWADTARMVTKHLVKCNLCHRYMHDATLSMDQSAKQVYDKAGDAPWIAVISNLRQSAGRYSINWTKKDINERPELILASFANAHHDETLAGSNTSSMEEDVNLQLKEHPAMACRLAFIQPIRRVKCGFESDSVWQFGQAEQANQGDSRSTCGYSASYHELNARAAQAEEYRSSCYNSNGITVLDLLLAASNTPDVPTDGLTDQPLVFGGILDDTLRGQNTIWVHATAAPEIDESAGSIMNNLITPSTYAYARETLGHHLNDHRHKHSASSTSIDWSRITEMNYGLCEPLGANYGFFPLVAS